MTPIEVSLWRYRKWIKKQNPRWGEDIFSEVVLRAIDLYGENAWLPRKMIAKITRSVCTDLYRHQKRQRTVSMEERGEPAEDLKAADAALRAEERQYVVALSAFLPPADRDALLRTLDGHSPAEIAAACGISVEAARSRIQRAREELRRMVKAADQN